MSLKGVFKSQEKSEDDYGRRVRGLAHGLWAGTIDWLQFSDSMADAVFRGYEQAWAEGAGRCGITRADRSEQEAYALQREIATDLGRVRLYADWIDKHSKEGGFKEGPVLDRAALWTNRYNGIATLAQVSACADQKLMWRYSSGVLNHCSDCSTYNGKVYRATVWNRYGAIPQSHFLECRGFKCGCVLEPTNAPVTPGFPRYPGGGR